MKKIMQILFASFMLVIVSVTVSGTPNKVAKKSNTTQVEQYVQQQSQTAVQTDQIGFKDATAAMMSNNQQDAAKNATSKVYAITTKPNQGASNKDGAGNVFKDVSQQVAFTRQMNQGNIKKDATGAGFKDVGDVKNGANNNQQTEVIQAKDDGSQFSVNYDSPASDTDTGFPGSTDSH